MGFLLADNDAVKNDGKIDRNHVEGSPPVPVLLP